MLGSSNTEQYIQVCVDDIKMDGTYQDGWNI